MKKKHKKTISNRITFNKKKGKFELPKQKVHMTYCSKTVLESQTTYKVEKRQPYRPWARFAKRVATVAMAFAMFTGLVSTAQADTLEPVTGGLTTSMIDQQVTNEKTVDVELAIDSLVTLKPGSQYYVDSEKHGVAYTTPNDYIGQHDQTGITGIATVDDHNQLIYSTFQSGVSVNEVKRMMEEQEITDYHVMLHLGHIAGNQFGNPYTLGWFAEDSVKQVYQNLEKEHVKVYAFGK